MSTRSLTVIYDEDGNEITVMYRQMDGYPTGHGKELADFLSNKTIRNGIQMGDTKDNAFNGAGCMAASIVSHFKDDIGNIYLCPVGTRNSWEEYIYEVCLVEGSIILKVYSCHHAGGNKKLWSGWPEAFDGEEIERIEEEE